MSKNLYVGNLSFQTTADHLREAFQQHGTVTSAQVVSDRDTGQSRGFGFVEMADGGEQAIVALNGTDLQGRTITVNEAGGCSTVFGRVIDTCSPVRRTRLRFTGNSAAIE